MAPEGAVHRERIQWFSLSVNFSLTALLVERSEPGAMCYTKAARPIHGEAITGATVECTQYTMLFRFFGFMFNAKVEQPVCSNASLLLYRFTVACYYLSFNEFLLRLSV